MRRWLPHPLMAGFLWLVWLLLQNSLAPGGMLLGAVLAWGLAWAFGKLRPSPVRLRRAWRLLPLLGRVTVDIVHSNLAVARLVLGSRRHCRSGFLQIPLQLTDPYGLAMLACIVTSTPGTIWVDHDAARQVLLIHVLDLHNEAAWIDTIKQRYERPLLEIFQ